MNVCVMLGALSTKLKYVWLTAQPQELKYVGNSDCELPTPDTDRPCV